MTTTLFALLLAAPPVDFALTGADGKPWRLADGKTTTVVAVLAVECPMSNHYLPVLAEAAKKYPNVAFVGIVPGETAARTAAHAKEYAIPFTVVADPDSKAAAALGAKVTPEVFVLTDKREVVYRGRIDDGFSARMKSKPVTRTDLTVALDELLAGKPISEKEHAAFGCPVIQPLKSAAATAVTYHKHIAPVLQQHCQGCHRPGQVAPFALTDYAHAVKWADLSKNEIETDAMPPWKAAPNALLAGDRHMPADAKKLFAAWCEAGCPEGNPADAPPAKKWADGWTLGEPDLILEVPADVSIAAAGKDHFRCVVLPTNLPEDKFITAMEVKPGNPRVVHHTLQLIDTSGQAAKLQAKAKDDPKAKDHGPGYVVQMGWGFTPDRTGMAGGWVPGMIPKHLPPGVGQKLPKGADVVVQFHYHRTGKAETDRTKVGLYFAKTPAKDHYRTVPVTGLFRTIPAGESAHKVESTWFTAADVTVYRLSPHMHLLGRDIELVRTDAAGKETTLIRVPAWDYNWQEQYELKTPLKLPKGTQLTIRATYDNSTGNPKNPSSPPKSARLGEQTTDEMCFVFLGVSSASSSPRLITPFRR